VRILTVGQKPSHRRHRGSRLQDDVAPGEPEDVVSERFELEIAGPVAFEGGATSVRPVAVELEDQSCIRPEEIDKEGSGANVDMGLREPVPAAERKEARFQLTARVVRLKLLIEREAQVLGLTKGRSEMRLRKETTEVSERAGRRRHRDADPPRYFAGEESPGSVHANPVTASCFSGNRDVRARGLNIG
jgi:hypothetical protein